ncbi:MAG: SDR family oxidoreductase [Acidithiobacillus sp.]|nr:SDR family oxidoreductase [Acidithiobacillus sp.]
MGYNHDSFLGWGGVVESKIVLITGAARRVGAAIAVELAARGCSLGLHYRHSKADAERLAAQIRERWSVPVHLFPGDLLDPAFPARLIEQVVGKLGGLDGLVNNASLFRPSPLAGLALEEWARMEGIHIRAPLFLTQAAWPLLRERQGCVVNLTDIQAEIPLSGHLAYTVSKAGLLALSKALAKEMGPEVRVNSVSPGVVLWAEGMDPPDGDRAGLLAKTALKREGQPQDIAKAVAFLLLDAPYVTGHNLVVDGGRMLY